MKFDSEQVFPHSTLDSKTDSKAQSFVSEPKHLEKEDNSLDPTGQPGQDIGKENQNEVICDLMGKRGHGDLLPYAVTDMNSWPAAELDFSAGQDNSRKENEKEISDFMKSQASEKLDLFEESVFYMDKSVMGCEVPELMVCYKENAYHVVKDICVDEGVPVQGKFLFRSDMDDKTICGFLPLDKDQDSKAVKQKSDSNIPLPDNSIFPKENESDKGTFNQSDTKDLMLRKEVKDDAMEKIDDDVSKEFTLGELLSIPESGTENDLKSLDGKSNGVEQHLFLSSGEKEFLSSPASIPSDEGSKNASEEEVLAGSGLASAVEESNSSNEQVILVSLAEVSASIESTTNSSLRNEVSYDSKWDGGSITFDFGSSATAASKSEDRYQNHDIQSIETRNTSLHEEAHGQPISYHLQPVQREPSSSVTGSVSGLISYSGPIAFSGSLSIRSDSSTTSNRSFAFPILQSEWNSSPIRMAKADRRNLRKRGWSWRQCLFCCRF